MRNISNYNITSSFAVNLTSNFWQEKTQSNLVRDAQGNVMAVYEKKHFNNGKEELTLQEQHLYGSSRLGMRQTNLLLAKTGENKEFDLAKSGRVLGEKLFELSNHLGNVLAVVSDKRLANNEPDVKTVYDYYPFGAYLPNRTNYDPASDYRYSYNGHEKDNEVKGNGNHISWGDYGMDTRLGKRWNIDPLYHKLPGQSPYSVNNNSPNLFFDPTGLAGEVIETQGAGTKENPHVKEIRAEYYYNRNNLSSAQVSGLNDAISEYNRTVSTEGNAKNGTFTQTRYNLSVRAFDTDEEVSNAVSNSYFRNTDGVNVPYGNSVSVGQVVLNENGNNRLGEGGNYTVRLFGNAVGKASGNLNIPESKVSEYAFLHEIGHNLGAEHGDPSPMKAEMYFFPIMKNGCMGDANCIESWNISSGTTTLSKTLAPALIQRMNNGARYLNIRGQED